MKLYDGGRAPNPRRVQIFLQEKGIEIEKVPVNIGKLEQKQAPFAVLNPLMRLPVLELDDGTILTETIAICRYFEGMQPEPPLMGVGVLDSAIVEMWQRRCELNLFVPVSQSFRHRNPAAAALEGEQFERWGEINQSRAIEFMGFLDGELEAREFIAGDRFSIADITALAACQFLKPARITFPEELENLKRWFDQVASRPGAAW